MTLGVAIEALCALRGKYQRMREMRRAHDDGTEQDPRVQMRALATEFPGALRELDELPLTTIEQRIAQLSDAIERDLPPTSWMIWMVDYHAQLRLALHQKRVGAPLSKPAGTRLNSWVFEQLAERYGVLATDVEAQLFPARRPRG